MEGSVFVGGAVVQWLRDGTPSMGRAQAEEAMARWERAVRQATAL